MFLESKSENQQIFLPELEGKNIQLFIKREDKIHPDVSGNKFRKLKYNLVKAIQQKKQMVLTFGGAYSNHILATAAAGNINNLKTVGIIRGDELGNDLESTLTSNPTLQKSADYGMQFEFISRERYREKYDPTFLKSLEEKFGDFHLIPEGGTNELAVQGCEEILTNDDEQFDYICCCVGTGGTLSGLICSSKHYQKIIGFPALKGNFLKEEVAKRVHRRENWKLMNEYHFGGYAKFSDGLIHFINRFKAQTDIPLDPIYTGKMMFGILDMIEKDQFSKNAKILVIHTGGLQGIEGFNKMLEKKKRELKLDA